MKIDSHGYDGIVAWGRYMCWTIAETQQLCNLARDEQAPSDVLFWRGPQPVGAWAHIAGRWVRPAEVIDPEVREALGLPPMPHPEVGSALIGPAVLRGLLDGSRGAVYHLEVWDLRVEVRQLPDGETVLTVRRDGVEEPLVLDGSDGV